MTDVFISYSRRDKEFVSELVDRLTARGKDCWVDWDDIPPTAEWVQEIYQGIEGSDAFLFVITPDSARSVPCRDEIEHAQSLNKRIVPILRRAVDGVALPDAIASRNWILLPESADVDEAVGPLIEAIERDLENVRSHTRLLQKALEWTSSNRDGSLLLRGSELGAAEAWLARASSLEPVPTPLHYEYVQASRAAATRRQRIVMAAFGVGIAVALALAALALLQRNRAVAQRKTAESRLLAGEALTQLNNRLDLGAMLALAAYRIKPTPQARDSVLVAMRRTDRLAGTFAAGGDVDIVRVGPGGAVIAVGRADGSILLWDRVRHRKLVERRGGGGAVRALAFSSDGALLAAVAEKGTLRLWRLGGTAAMQPVDVPRMVVGAVVFAPHGHELIVATSDGVSFWAPGSAAPRPVKGTSELRDVNELAVAADGAIAAGGPYGASLLEPSLRGFRIVSIGGDEPVQDLAFAPHGRRLAVVQGKQVFLWTPGKPLRTVPVSGANAAAFGLGGKLATGTDSGAVIVWTGNATTRSSVLRLGEAAVESVAFDLTNDLLISASAARVAIWDGSGSRLTVQRRLPLQTLDSLAIAGPNAFVAGGDGTVVEGDLRTGRSKTLAGAPTGFITVAASRDGRIVAAGGQDSVVVWTPNGRQPRRSGVGGPALALSADGTTIAAGGKGRLELWDWRAQRPRPAGVPLTSKSVVSAIASSPTEHVFAAGALDGSVSVVRLGARPPEPLQAGARRGVIALAFAPDGRRLAAASDDGTVALLRVGSKLERAFAVAVGRKVTSVAFDPSGRTLAVGRETARGGLVALFDVHDRVALGPPLQLSDAAVSVAFAAAGSTLLVGLHGGKLALFERGVWDPDAARDSLCARLGRSLTAAERNAYLPSGAPNDVCS
jgi:WD40 repeat protein